MLFKKKKNNEKKLSLMDLENKEETTKLDIPGKNKKTVKPATVGMLKLARGFIWGAFIFVFAIGVFQIVRNKQPRIIKNIVEYNIAASESETAKAFALTFAKEYLTYNNINAQEYNDRVNPFMLPALNSGTKIEYSKGKSTVIDAIVWKVEKINKEHSNVVVRATTEITNDVDVTSVPDATGKATKAPKVQRKVVYLSVPVGYYGNRYIVEDYPTFRADAQYAQDAALETYAGNEEEMDDVKVKLQEVLSNFFQTYCTGNEGQIAYYMDNNKEVRGYEGKYKFNGIKTMNVYNDGSDKVTVVAQVGMQDAELDTLFTQRFIFKMIKKTEGSTQRWYITDFTGRGMLYKN